MRFNWSGRQIDIKEITYEWEYIELNKQAAPFFRNDYGQSTLHELSFDKVR
jgi:hypothetical protein